MAKLDRHRLVAVFWLAVGFWAHVFTRVWKRLTRRPGEPTQLETFTGNYRADGIWLLDAAARAALPPLGECVSCRLCDPVCPSMHAEHGRGFVGPSRLVMSNHRLPPAVATWIDPFLCIRCRACDDACPQGVPIDRMVGLMRGAVAREAAAEVPAPLREAVDRIARAGHLAGEPPAAPRRDRGTADHTYVASCAASAADIEAETALLARAGVDYATAPPSCCGGFGARALGEPARGLGEALAKARAFTVVTADPRCFEHMRSEGGYKDLDIRHVLEVAADVRATVASGGEPEDAPKVTYHDPCHLVRLPGGTVFPREALRRAGGELAEMRLHGREAPCCGMSGGTFTFNPALAEELGRARVRAAVATGADLLLTQSSLCRDHLARCVKLEEAALEVRNVTEFLADRSGALKASGELKAAGEAAAAPPPAVASHPIQHWEPDLPNPDQNVNKAPETATGAASGGTS